MNEEKTVPKITIRSLNFDIKKATALKLKNVVIELKKTRKRIIKEDTINLIVFLTAIYLCSYCAYILIFVSFFSALKYIITLALIIGFIIVIGYYVKRIIEIFKK